VLHQSLTQLLAERPTGPSCYLKIRIELWARFPAGPGHQKCTDRVGQPGARLVKPPGRFRGCDTNLRGKSLPGTAIPHIDTNDVTVFDRHAFNGFVHEFKKTWQPLFVLDFAEVIERLWVRRVVSLGLEHENFAASEFFLEVT
jgi:hypothetical protein